MNKPLFVVGGCKGGVGKSMTTLALLYDLSQRGERVVLIETDTSNPDTWRMHHQEADLIAETLDLDQAEGWIDLINVCNAYTERVIVVNTASRNNLGVAAYGKMLNKTLPEFQRRLVNLWVINTQRDSLELLEDYFQALPGSILHVVCNTLFGTPDRFDLYPSTAIYQEITRQGGKTMILDRLADRVSGDLYSKRLSVAKALQKGRDALPLGNRAELDRWCEEVARMFDAIVPSELVDAAHDIEAGCSA